MQRRVDQILKMRLSSLLALSAALGSVWGEADFYSVRTNLKEDMRGHMTSPDKYFRMYFFSDSL